MRSYYYVPCNKMVTHMLVGYTYRVTFFIDRLRRNVLQNWNELFVIPLTPDENLLLINWLDKRVPLMHPRTKPEFVSEIQQNEGLDEIENCCKN